MCTMHRGTGLRAWGAEVRGRPALASGEKDPAPCIYVDPGDTVPAADGGRRRTGWGRPSSGHQVLCGQQGSRAPWDPPGTLQSRGGLPVLSPEGVASTRPGAPGSSPPNPQGACHSLLASTLQPGSVQPGPARRAAPCSAGLASLAPQGTPDRGPMTHAQTAIVRLTAQSRRQRPERADRGSPGRGCRPHRGQEPGPEGAGGGVGCDLGGAVRAVTTGPPTCCPDLGPGACRPRPTGPGVCPDLTWEPRWALSGAGCDSGWGSSPRPQRRTADPGESCLCAWLWGPRGQEGRSGETGGLGQWTAAPGLEAAAGAGQRGRRSGEGPGGQTTSLTPWPCHPAPRP